MFKVFELNDSDGWNSFFSKLPIEQQDIYFTPEYYNLYEDLGEGKAKCFVFEKDGEIALYPFLLNSVNELGYDLDKQYYDIQGAYGYNGVVSSSYSDDFISSFYSSFDDYVLKNNIIAEYTRFHPILHNEKFNIDINVIEDRKTLFLDISKEYNDIWENCYSSVNRNMIRKAIKKNISLSISNEENDYLSFYEIYKSTMQNVGADEYYYFSENYFKNIKNLLGNNIKLIIAEINGKLICAMLLIFDGKYAHYFLSGRLREYSNTGVNNLILDEAIKIAKNEGCSCFHFGGGTTNSPNDPLLKFKSNFSKDKLTFYIGKKIHNNVVYNEITKQWAQCYPEMIEKYNNRLLKYRYKS